MSDKQKYKKGSMEQRETNSNAIYFNERSSSDLIRVKTDGCFYTGTLSMMFDEILNGTLSEKVSTTGITQENPEILQPNSL